MLPLGIEGLGLAVLGGRFMAGGALRPVRKFFERRRAFVADASHEFKTPLTLIRADAEVVLHRNSLNQEDRKLTEHALAELDQYPTAGAPPGRSIRVYSPDCVGRGFSEVRGRVL